MAARPIDVRERRPCGEGSGAPRRFRISRAWGERRGGAAGLEDYRVGRSLLIAAVPLRPVNFVMELNDVSGLVQGATLGVAFGVAAYVEQVRRGRHVILTDRRLVVFGSTWNLRPGELLERIVAANSR